MAPETGTVRRLDRYPERFRARVAGRVARVTASAPGASPRFEAELIVERSRPLPPAKTHPLTGMPLAEMTEDDFGNSDTVAVETSELPVSDFSADPRPTAGFLARRFSVLPEPEKSGPLYPDYPPLEEGQRLLLIWHGQREVPGLSAGTYIRCRGMLSLRATPATIYNPRYEIVPAHIIDSVDL